MVTVSFQLPESIEEGLRAELGDLSAAAKEAALVELYRQGQLSHGQFAECLGISRYEADGVLKRHGVVEDLLTPAELDKQLSELRGLIGS
jgi:predicted HTH domain antitoxin